MIDYRNGNEWSVYIHIVPKDVSGKQYDKYYVGITSMKPQRRWGSLGGGYKNNKHFYNAIQKYGWNNIEHVVIANNLTKSEACSMEVTLIDKLNTCNTEYGYNHNTGGTGCNGHVYTEEERKQISCRMSGINNPYYNKKHSDETKHLMSINHCDYRGYRHPRAKEVFQFTLNGQFVNKYGSCSDAGKINNINKNNICVAASKNQSCNGFLWVYRNNVDELSNGTYVIKEYKYNPEKPRNRVVYQFNYDGEFIKKYTSCMEASRQTKINIRTIISSARNKYKKCKYGNFIWRYEEDVMIDFEENEEEFI